MTAARDQPAGRAGRMVAAVVTVALWLAGVGDVTPAVATASTAESTSPRSATAEPSSPSPPTTHFYDDQHSSDGPGEMGWVLGIALVAVVGLAVIGAALAFSGASTRRH